MDDCDIISRVGPGIEINLATPNAESGHRMEDGHENSWLEVSAQHTYPPAAAKPIANHRDNSEISPSLLSLLEYRLESLGLDSKFSLLRATIFRIDLSVMPTSTFGKA